MKAGPPTGATGSLLCRFLAIVRECSCRHFAPHQSNSVWRFRGQSFPRGKALTYLGRGAMRLSRVRVEVTLARRGMQRLPGPGGPFRSEREPLGCAFREHPPASAMGSIKCLPSSDNRHGDPALQGWGGSAALLRVRYPGCHLKPRWRGRGARGVSLWRTGKTHGEARFGEAGNPSCEGGNPPAVSCGEEVEWQR
jgi:hypothetical protein